MMPNGKTEKIRYMRTSGKEHTWDLFASNPQGGLACKDVCGQMPGVDTFLNMMPHNLQYQTSQKRGQPRRVEGARCWEELHGAKCVPARVKAGLGEDVEYFLLNNTCRSKKTGKQYVYI